MASTLDHGFFPVASGREFPRLRCRFVGRPDFESATVYWKELVTLADEIAGRVPSRVVMTVRLSAAQARHFHVTAGHLLERYGYDPQ